MFLVKVANIDISYIITLLASICAIYFALKKSKKEDKADIEAKAKESAIINVKLDQIGTDVRDIKYDITSVKQDVKDLDVRVVKTEKDIIRLSATILKGDDQNED